VRLPRSRQGSPLPRVTQQALLLVLIPTVSSFVPVLRAGGRGREMRSGSSDGALSAVSSELGSRLTSHQQRATIRLLMSRSEQLDGAVVASGSSGGLAVTPIFESRRANGNRLITLAASLTCATVQPFGRPEVADGERCISSPIEVDGGTSLLYVRGPRDRGVSRSEVAADVAPANVRLVAER
jgi:hypothetical protein